MLTLWHLWVAATRETTLTRWHLPKLKLQIFTISFLIRKNINLSLFAHFPLMGDVRVIFRLNLASSMDRLSLSGSLLQSMNNILHRRLILTYIRDHICASPVATFCLQPRVGFGALVVVTVHLQKYGFLLNRGCWFLQLLLAFVHRWSGKLLLPGKTCCPLHALVSWSSL